MRYSDNASSEIDSISRVHLKQQLSRGYAIDYSGYFGFKIKGNYTLNASNDRIILW